MRIKWAALFSGASLLLASASASAQAPLTLSGAQLDGVVPTYQYDPSRYQVRVVIEAVVVTGSDRVRDALLTDDAEAMEAQRMPAEEPEVRCTPARRALLARAGRSESPGELTSQQGAARTTSSAPLRRSADTGASRLAAASPESSVIGRAASPAQAVSASTGSSQPTAVRNAGSSGRQVGAKSSRPAATVNHGSSARQAVSGSNRPPAMTSAGAAGKRAPAAAVASRAPKTEVPIRTVRSDNPSRSSGAGAVRAASGANASDIVARVRSQVNRTLSAVPGGTFRLR
jgi:hypothetical protein